MSNQTVVSAFAALLLNGEQSVAKTKLTEFKALLGKYDKATIQDAIRQKAKDETIAPLRAELIAKGMAETSAKTRHMEIATLHAAWLTGFSLEGQSDWNKAVEQARQHRKALADTAKSVKEGVAIGSLIYKHKVNMDAKTPEQIGRAVELAESEYKEVKAAEKVGTVLDRLDTLAATVGAKVLAYRETDTPQDWAENLIQTVGIVHAAEIGEALLLMIAEKNEQAAQAEAERNETEQITIATPQDTVEV